MPENKTIVLLSHVSLHDIFIMPLTMKALFKALENHEKILAVSGHMHRIITYDYTAEQGWKNSTEFEGLVAGAASGAWWSGALDENNIPYSICLDGSPKGFFQLNTKGEDYNYVFHAADDTTDLQMRIYLKEDEIRVNWFVGKRTDSVWVYIDDNPMAIKLQNFMAAEPLAEPYSNDGIHVDYHTLEFEQVAHLWKAKLTEELLPGKHTVKVFARDSKGKIFNEYKVFYLDKE